MKMKMLWTTLVTLCVITISGGGIASAAPARGGIGGADVPAIQDFHCDAIKVAVGEPVACHYEVGGMSLEPVTTIGSRGGLVRITSLASSVACGPGGERCVYWASGYFSVTYGAPGNKTISISTCAAGRCAEQTVSVMVQKAKPFSQARSGE